MHFSLASTLGLAGLVAQAAGHGLVQKPATRAPGDATAAACGKTMATFYKADNTSYPEALLRANPSGLKDGYDAKKCNLYLCRGYQFADNAANVQKYKPGDVVDLEVWIRIAHEGHANVSIVDTASNAVIGAPLLSWAKGYAASTKPPVDQTKFSVKVPELGGKCTEAGACVVQWYWFGQGQTYESCIDFTVPAPAHAHGRRDNVRGRRVWQ
ncbi:hypothetical protein B0T25DRAFT_450556 [Lasiosphaeria hispida]|uniref:Chitin-binding type-4 domain-containing protein n=1 Tax=Lasiosphaeria hispida TaxID=260671 RepID=A0AAJ0HKZ0_9PEZI|nr:hypothetical protein B0T25DRAFT_450556 [Lasiosphaeria hispida]